MKNYKTLLIILLMGITVFTSFKYISYQKERYALLDILSEIKRGTATLENEKQNLLQALQKENALLQKITQENTGLKDSLKARQEQLVKLEASSAEARKTIEGLTSQASALKAENAALGTDKTRLSKENESLKAKLSSIPELKKTIKELKRQMRQVSQITLGIKREAKNEKLPEGNRGFLMKDGRSTYRAKVRIEVTPVSTHK